MARRRGEGSGPACTLLHPLTHSYEGSGPACIPLQPLTHPYLPGGTLTPPHGLADGHGQDGGLHGARPRHARAGQDGRHLQQHPRRAVDRRAQEVRARPQGVQVLRCAASGPGPENSFPPHKFRPHHTPSGPTLQPVHFHTAASTSHPLHLQAARTAPAGRQQTSSSPRRPPSSHRRRSTARMRSSATA